MYGKSLKVTARPPQTLPGAESDAFYQGLAFPEGLHLSHASGFETVDLEISEVYNLGLSSPMKLDDLSAAFEAMLTEYGQPTPVGAWLDRPEKDVMKCYSMCYSKELVAK
ncbi:MAG: hypothetical protein ALECFALPRED_002130 [Alectoria fallacina]|uniref:Uncharacterized protein n=1 Tax=Alectoria fallacina TaxID=1903189 RepID=A0A8H3IC46_9LECA|nr:MAG: hypothetical protein ALECFALPRED_002130 [Alectoria fallacina]